MHFTTGSNKCRLAEFSIHDGQKGTFSIAAVRVENKSKLVLCRQTGSSGPIFIPSAFSTIRWLSSEDRGPSFERQWIINARGTGRVLICGSTSITRQCHWSTYSVNYPVWSPYFLGSSMYVVIRVLRKSDQVERHFLCTTLQSKHCMYCMYIGNQPNSS